MGSVHSGQLDELVTLHDLVIDAAANIGEGMTYLGHEPFNVVDAVDDHLLASASARCNGGRICHLPLKDLPGCPVLRRVAARVGRPYSDVQESALQLESTPDTPMAISTSYGTCK